MFLEAFDAQIKTAGAAGNLDALNTLTNQKDSFIARGTLPASPLMKDAVEAYGQAIRKADGALAMEYESAITEYTKGSRVAEAMEMRRQRRLLLEGHDDVAPAAGSSSAEGIAAALDKAKADYQAAVNEARRLELAAVDARMDAVTRTGDLKALNALRPIRDGVEATGNIPADATDPALLPARSQYSRSIRSANITLATAYKVAVREYTRGKHIDEAQATQSELESIGLAGVTGNEGAGAPAAGGGDTGMHKLAKILPSYLTAASFTAEKDGIRPKEPFAHTKVGTVLTQDFVFDVTVDIANNGTGYVGIGQANPTSNEYNQHWAGLTLRSLADHHGEVDFRLDEHWGKKIGSISEPGTYLVRIEKRGPTITYSVGVEKNGQFVPDITHTVADIKTAQPAFNDRNAHLAFGGDVLYRGVRYVTGAAAVAMTATPGDTGGSVPSMPVTLPKAKAPANATAVPPAPSPGPAAVEAKHPKVTSARWGGGSHWSDVTERINTLLAAEKPIYANSKTLGRRSHARV